MSGSLRSRPKPTKISYDGETWQELATFEIQTFAYVRIIEFDDGSRLDLSKAKESGFGWEWPMRKAAQMDPAAVMDALREAAKQ